VGPDKLSLVSIWEPTRDSHMILWGLFMIVSYSLYNFVPIHTLVILFNVFIFKFLCLKFGGVDPNSANFSRFYSPFGINLVLRDNILSHPSSLFGISCNFIGWYHLETEFETSEGQCHEIFDLWFFFRQSITPRPQMNTLKYFRFLFRIRWEINEHVLIPRYAAQRRIMIPRYAA
jgi:hypothetical protein